MADVLKRGPLEDDQAIFQEITDLLEILQPRSQALLSGEPEQAISFAALLEDVGNRMIDMSDAINNWYLEPGTTMPLPDMPDFLKNWKEWGS